MEQAIWQAQNDADLEDEELVFTLARFLGYWGTVGVLQQPGGSLWDLNSDRLLYRTQTLANLRRPNVKTVLTLIEIDRKMFYVKRAKASSSRKNNPHRHPIRSIIVSARVPKWTMDYHKIIISTRLRLPTALRGT
eukprot:1183447-Prorocentrum_minimum.AAC.1